MRSLLPMVVPSQQYVCHQLLPKYPGIESEPQIEPKYLPFHLSCMENGYILEPNDVQ